MTMRVPGATVFVGSHAAARLVAQGHPVRLLVRDPAKVATFAGSRTSKRTGWPCATSRAAACEPTKTVAPGTRIVMGRADQLRESRASRRRSSRYSHTRVTVSPYAAYHSIVFGAPA